MDNKKSDDIMAMAHVLRNACMDSIITPDVMQNEIRKWNERLASQKRKDKIKKIKKNINKKK